MNLEPSDIDAVNAYRRERPDDYVAVRGGVVIGSSPDFDLAWELFNEDEEPLVIVPWNKKIDPPIVRGRALAGWVPGGSKAS